ncbi:MAG: M20/M25/M40 family metallo-hydrolase [bacterium]
MRGRTRKSAFPAIAAVLLGTVVAAAEPSPDARVAADRILGAALESDGAWDKLTELCDGVGHRLSGSPQLARAVDWATERMALDGLENVRRQRVLVPRWVRGEESCEMVAPRRQNVPMLGLGRSVGTPAGGVTGDVVVVPDFDAFERLPERDVRGRIVLWNAPFTTYGETVKYRWDGAKKASDKGAIASVIRSVGRRTLRSPHTGAMRAWEDGERAIPAAALAIEDAEMIARLASQGETVRLRLEMDARTDPDAESHNVMGEIVGREKPNEVVVIGGHLDSWDVGQGAHDDGGGCVVSMEAVRLLHELGLRPRRTVRVVLWTNEENGTRGADAYGEAAANGTEIHFAAIESDGGVENPWGFGLSVWEPGEDHTVDEAGQAWWLERLREYAEFLRPVGADSLRAGGGGADITPLMEKGVPGLALRTPMDLYWDIHHTHADTVDKVDPEALRRNVAAMAFMAWAIADLPDTVQ